MMPVIGAVWIVKGDILAHTKQLVDNCRSLPEVFLALLSCSSPRDLIAIMVLRLQWDGPSPSITLLFQPCFGHNLYQP